MTAMGYNFKPKLWSIALTILFGVIFFELGKWQLSRADEKNVQHEQLEKYAMQPAVTLPGNPIKLVDYQYRDVEIRGEYLADETIFLDNRTYQGRAGYHVITPLKISNSSMFVAINRGWVATGNDRSVLPLVTTDRGEVTVFGTVVSPEIRMLELSGSTLSGPVWDNFNLEKYQEITGLKMQPIMVLQKDEIEDGLIRSWHKPDSGASKNIGYAVQWFSLAVTTIIIFIVLNVKRTNSEGK
ncbi:SURF1 family protein [Nitrosomonas supralitoralis]|uniref:SURF1-like protein n=1 Tax=Nitrosomonas supralitoralis TaxID=2116706 RepID=A0A2P7NZ16_9PROT|nr:SURF1 family protein [Nitrosomonas supralitoralis]PSJ18702.1 SURF1 family protein [Nitrosomonas supralitoralis]